MFFFKQSTEHYNSIPFVYNFLCVVFWNDTQGNITKSTFGGRGEENEMHDKEGLFFVLYFFVQT